MQLLITQYKVWDAPTRLFHWVNVISVVLPVLYKKDLGTVSLDAKVAIKELHVLIGYVFEVNLMIRLGWGFIGNRFARWSNILPGRGFGATMAAYTASIKNGQRQQFMGHNPMGRLAVVVLMALLMTQAITGLIRAGTDVYYPPFGAIFAARVAAGGVDPTTIKAYNKTGTDAKKYQALHDFKHIYGEIHYYTFFVLLAMMLLHIVVVIRMDISQGNGLISAMFTGRKTLSQPPADGDHSQPHESTS